MLLVIRFFPEITIKTRQVRRRFIKRLRRNLLLLLRRIDADVKITGEWDNFEVASESGDPEVLELLQTTLANTPGIDSIFQVKKTPLPDLPGILAYTKAFYQDLLPGQTFAVRCKRQGKHDFTSIEVERFVGAGLLQETSNAGVNLSNPDVTVRINIQRNELFVVQKMTAGLGGYPLGSQDGVLSLISGGFDSGVSSFQCIKRGLITHYCFFNLGGKAHELAVKELALYLWMKYGSSHKVKFITVPFEVLMAEIVNKVDSSQMAVVLKRMMMRAANQVAADTNVEAIVTGESVAQVSSQTLANLALIDSVCDTMVLRPLIFTDKQDIIDIARRIGTEEFSSAIPEYCGVISVKPTTRARPERIAEEEAKFDFAALLQQALDNRAVQRIDRVVEGLGNQVNEPEVFAQVPDGAIVIDIRHPDEQILRPLHLSAATRAIPFYQLSSAFARLDANTQYLLYCDKGIMSRLHASHLQDAGYTNASVYRPAV